MVGGEIDLEERIKNYFHGILAGKIAVPDVMFLQIIYYQNI